MAALDVTLLLLEIALSGLAWLEARRRPGHWPLALYLSWMAAESPLRRFARSFRSGPSSDFAGLALASFHVDKLIVLSWTFGFLALVLRYFLRWPAWPALVAGLVVWGIALPHPYMTGDRLAELYSYVYAGGVVVTWLAIGWAMLVRPGSVEPALPQWVLLAYASFDFVCALAPYVELQFIAQWEQLRLASILITLGAIGAHLFWRIRWRPREVRSGRS
ncbi:MAG: hypothetical protein KC619_19115 [Myxococcales bacterium]|nr:hypothetical protein [Myxococcales bacterium]